MTNYEVLFKKITCLCAEMISFGGSSEIVPVRMNDICSRYGLKESEFIVKSSGVFATAVSPEGDNLVAICAVDGIGSDFGKLQKFDEYCNTVCETLPSAEELEAAVSRIKKAGAFHPWAVYPASIMLGTGFAILFGCGLADALIAVAACVLIVFLGSILKKLNTNLFFDNAVICLLVVSMILAAARYTNICSHPESVTLGVIMLLISGLSFSDGLWAMINKDTTIGIYKLNNAVVGAIGIVIGTATPLLLIDDVAVKGQSINAALPVQVLLCIIACSGFAILCGTERKSVPVVGLGAGLSWLVYAVFSKFCPSLFINMAAGTFAVTLYAIAADKKLKLNPNITRIVGILPLVPGTNLFYLLYYLVTKNNAMAAAEGMKLITACLGISFGFSLGRLFYKK